MSNKPLDLALPVSLDRLVEFAKEAYWYHTIELYPGVKTSGMFDHSPYLHHFGFPESMSGWTVLDVGSSDGFFSFEFERRASLRVLAVDSNKYDGSVAIDPSPAHMNSYVNKYHSYQQINIKFSDVYEALGVPCGHQFMAAKTLLGSQVEYRNLSVYDLASLNTKFDFVFCGALIEHLKHPLLALENLVSVTKEQCIIVLCHVPSDQFDRNRKLGSVRWKLLYFFAKILQMPIPFDSVRTLKYVGNDSGGAFFYFYPETFRQALLASGFRRVEIYSQFALPKLKRGGQNLHVVYHCFTEG